MARCGCGEECACTVQGGTGTTVTGSGTPANPYVITSTGATCDQVRPCLSGGTGVTYNPATGVISAGAPSCNDVRPCLSAGPGITYNSATGVIAADPQATDCPAVRGCISGGAGITYNPATGVISAGAPNCADVRTCLSAGAGITYNSVTGVISSNAAAPVLGCGLTGSGTMASPLAAQVSVWPYACDLDANAELVYCDSSGALRGEPDRHIARVQTSENDDIPATLVPTVAQQTIQTVSITITNPDPCRQADVILNGDLDIDFNLPPGATAAAGFMGDETEDIANMGSSTAVDTHVETAQTQFFSLAPSAVFNFNSNITLGRGTNGATYNRIQWSLRSFLITV